MFELSRERGQPVYLQIIEQVRRRVAAGHLEGGAPLPSVRALAEQLGINPNTVARAYQELERLGVVETRHGQGTFVKAPEAGPAPARRLLVEHARRFARVAQELGATLEDAHAALEEEWTP